MADNKQYEAHDVEGSHPLMVHVTAPTKLPEGYSFEAVLADGTPFSCKVVGTSNQSTPMVKSLARNLSRINSQVGKRKHSEIQLG